MGLRAGWGRAHQDVPKPRGQHGASPGPGPGSALGKPALKANRETVLFVGAEQRAPRVHKASLPGPHSVCLSSGGGPLGTQGGGRTSSQGGPSTGRMLFQKPEDLGLVQTSSSGLSYSAFWEPFWEASTRGHLDEWEPEGRWGDL